MKIHRFIGSFDLDADRLLIRDVGVVHQIRTVLKLRPGEKIVLANGNGREAIVQIADVGKTGIETAIIERRLSDEPPRRVILYCAIVKRDNFEYACQKAVECGASVIVPIITGRTVKLGLNTDRLAKIVAEAAEQCGRGKIPAIAPSHSFGAAIKEASVNGANYFFDGTGKEWSGARASADSVGVWIGPEGGWEDSEVAAAREAGFAVVSLGPLTLRAETAATVAVYLVAR
jgi:16S rRNA (uracil1498-N3)-methyltransferase